MVKLNDKIVMTFEDRIRQVKESGIIHSEDQFEEDCRDEREGMESISVRIKKILKISDDRKRSTDMLFFVMYDIENNKVRRLVAKYLIEMGCQRVQKSIYLGNLSHDKYERIKADLTQVQAYYDNEDSILVVPVSNDHLKAMKMIGQNIDFDIVTRSKSTLFF